VPHERARTGEIAQEAARDGEEADP
jgi:hypothetical protein